MIRIALRDEISTFIDDADLMLVSGFSWRPLQTDSDITYVHAWNRNQHLYMHRLIAGAGPKEHVDHWDGNGLNNQQLNLRIATPSQNRANQGKPRGARTFASGFKGVYRDNGRGRWIAGIYHNGKSRCIGRFDTEELAARAYDQAASEVWGRFARLNFPVETIIVCSFHDLVVQDAPCTCGLKDSHSQPHGVGMSVAP